MRPQPPRGHVSRRNLLLLGTATLMASALPSLALAPAQGVPGAALAAKFADVSQRLVNHRLSPAVGARIAGFAAQQYPDLEPMLDQVLQIATAKNATRVEEFYGDLPEGQLRDFAYWIISAWYTGSSSTARDATLFTYEEALLYQPTLDMVPIPTFGISGPNAWGRDLYPLSDLPRF